MKIKAILIGIGVMMTQTEGRLISHQAAVTDVNITSIHKRIKEKKALTLSLDETLQLLAELNQFELGRFLLNNQGLNGYWTSYLIVHGPKETRQSALENWLLNDAPVVRATQERFKIFQRVIQDRLRASTTLASIPCGLMDDLLLLDYSHTPNVRLVGIDLDPESLELAAKNAEANGNCNAVFMQKNAWELNIKGAYDLITSNGLNIYQPDEHKVIELYKNFHQALKPNGILVISFLTPPPATSKESTWKNLDPIHLKKQKAVFADIIEAKWQVFRTESAMRQQLETAGFKVLQVIYDRQGMFPSVVAEKR